MDGLAALVRESLGSDPYSGVIYVFRAKLVGLLAATGMRIAEALTLQIDDVITDGLVVREAKFQKSRPRLLI